MSERDEELMRAAIELAAIAEGHTRPNPLVGCVIARDAEVLARGYHTRAGEPHAEVAALRQLAPGAARGADLYVNLEPCCTHGRTPPCTDAIIEAGIARVFVGTVDTNPRHQGAGIAALQAAGIEVVTGICERESRALNAPYFSTMERRRPLVAAKWAMSLDGKIATRSGHSAWITGEPSREYVHRLRARYDAIMVGSGTVIADDPRLTCRLPGGRDPVRVVLDARLESNPAARVFDIPGTVVAHGAGLDFTPFGARGARPLVVDTSDDGRLDLAEVLRRLLDFQVMSVLVEGGGTLLGSMFDAHLVDRVYAFVAPVVIGGRDAVTAVAGVGAAQIAESLRLDDVRIERFGDDVLVLGEVRQCSQGS